MSCMHCVDMCDVMNLRIQTYIYVADGITSAIVIPCANIVIQTANYVIKIAYLVIEIAKIVMKIGNSIFKIAEISIKIANIRVCDLVVKALDPRSRGQGFDSRSAGCVFWASFESTLALSTHQ